MVYFVRGEDCWVGVSHWLADIVLFGLSLKVFKTRMLGRGFHSLIKNVSFPSPINVGSHVR